MYQGEPILAVAAVDELTAAEAIEKIEIEFEPLPFVVDPLSQPAARRSERARSKATSGDASRPRSRPAARSAGRSQELKWTEEDFAEYDEGKLPMGKTPDEWAYGDLEAGFKNAALVLDETFVDAEHQPSDARAAHGDGLLAERQAVPARRHAEHRADGRLDRALDRHRSRRTSCSSASTPAAASAARRPARSRRSIPALLVEEDRTRRCMMRISREEEHYIGGARPALHGRVKVGFAKDGRITGARHVRRWRERSLRSSRATPAGGPHRVAAVPAAGDALARRCRC